jgi:phosphate-selective porin OprO and OprP
VRPALAALAILATAANLHAQTAPAPPVVDVGFGRGLTIRSADDSASLNIRARIQVRSTIVDNPDEVTDSSEISIRRARLVFQGNASGPSVTYYLQLSFSNLDNEADVRLPLRDAYITWSPSRDIIVRVGQMKVPFSRQRLTSSSALQMVDRSIVVSELNLDRDVGVQVFSRDLLGVGKLGYSLGLFGGEGRNRLGRAIGFLYTARIEAWPLGPFDELFESDLGRGDRLRLAVAANVGYNQNTNRPRSTIGSPYPSGDFDYLHAGGDFMLKWRGWSVTSEVMYRRADRPTLTVLSAGAPLTIVARPGWGAFVQSGLMVSPRVEVSGRYSRLSPLSNNADRTFVGTNEFSAGLGYYPRGHDLKVQGDMSQNSDRAAHRNTRQARLQLQLFF